jgi:serine/threonine protein kinase
VSGRAELRVEAGQNPGRSYLLALGQRLILGRADDADVRILDTASSRHHVAVELGPAGLSVTDLGSKNGTLLDGARLAPNQPQFVFAATIAIGEHRVRVEQLGGRMRDDYEQLAELGRGAAGIVFAARHRATGRTVAVKSLLSKVSGIAARERFVREGRVRIESPHVVQVYDVRIEGEQVYLILELVEGESLEARLRRAGPLPLAEVTEVCRQLAVALQAAHETGVVHRDVKPANVLISSAGVVKLGDFGIAKLLKGSGDSLTATGTGMGTLSYVSPEQMQDAKRVSPASDLYGLGATAYHTLTGRPPFLPGTEQIIQIFEDEPPSLKRLRSDCPKALASLVHRLLEKDPRDRPQSAEAVARQLGAMARS